jgi:putative hemolysin
LNSLNPTLVDLSNYSPHPSVTWLSKPVSNFLGIDWLNREYQKIPPEKASFFSKCLKHLNITYEVESKEEIPTEGSLLVMANHPFGAIDGMMMGDWLMSQRTDVKILANGILGKLPDIKDMLIEVNPFGGHALANARGMAQALKWLKEGHVLLTFPAGEVSGFSFKERKIKDPEWTLHMARLARKSNTRVLTAFLEGRNSILFYGAGLIHPFLRTLCLGRELKNKIHQHFKITSGYCWDSKTCSNFSNDQDLIDFFRDQTYALNPRHKKSAFFSKNPKLKKIINPIPPSLLIKDIQALSPKSLLFRRKPVRVYAAMAWEIPHILQEIGRLRELTFRATGEGSGLEADIDEHDEHYVHLFSWDEENSCVIGAYRIGRTDKIIEEHGVQGLYSHTLFRLSPVLIHHLGDGLELGRSFIRKEYQMSRHGLPLLWQGICKYAYQHPQYQKLYGCVSICSEYQKESIDLMIDYCKIFRSPQENNLTTKPINPYKRKSLTKNWLKSLEGKNISPEELSRWVSTIEPDRKGIPILLRHYLRLGANIISFNVDKSFGNVVDGLVMIDLKLADRKMLERFMGKAETQLYLEKFSTTSHIGEHQNQCLA